MRTSVEETTEKYGLEAGLFQSMKSGDGGASAKDLLAKYGVAYLATSIPLAAVSFGLCYLLVDNGVDVAGLLSNVGINVGESGEKAGTVVEMENFYSRLALDIIGKAVFNYDFDSLKKDDPVIKASRSRPCSSVVDSVFKRRPSTTREGLRPFGSLKLRLSGPTVSDKRPS